MQTEKQDGHSLNGYRDRDDASLFPHVSSVSDVSESEAHGRWEAWRDWGEREDWDDEEVENIEDIYKTLPITPTSPQMPERPPLFSLPTLITPEVHPASTDEVGEVPLKSEEVSSSPTALTSNRVYVDMVEQAIDRLNDAARRIAAVEQKKDRRSPKASRLSPFKDISGEIQRQSTPMPNIPPTPVGFQSSSVDERSMPDLWPWIPDTEENDQDLWANHTDPLVRRQFPRSNETARLEEEDARRARAEGFRISLSGRGQASTKMKRLRKLFAFLTIMAICALLVDAGLVSLAFIRQHHTTPPVVNGPPTLTISVEGAARNQATYGQNITLHLQHFSPLSSVYITHDVEEPIFLGNRTSFISVNNVGAADVTTSVDQNWSPGFHTVDAEDYKTRYTANATLEIINSGPTHPSHLSINTTKLDFQSDIQGANTIQPLTLSNDGNAAISWVASSNQSWLVLTPNQGIFSNTETIEVAVQRGTLTQGDYTGKITFSSNVSAPIVVSVQMSVVSLPQNAGPVLAVTPAVLSFTAQDGGVNPAGQELVVSNPGTQPLSWSLTNNALASATDQNSFLNAANPGAANWLTVSQSSGNVVPKDKNVLNVTVNSQNLLPGAYIDTLLFSGSGQLNKTQSVSISLTVLPQCGLTLSTGAMTFTSVVSNSNSTVQPLNVSATSGCSSPINWQASSSASWLQITPTSGQATTTTSSVISVGVNASSMSAGTYPGTITVTNGTSTQSVQVTLQVQTPPSPTAPIMSASPLTMSFTAIEGQSKPETQAVVISNTGGSALQWHTQVNLLANGWLGVSPTGGTVNAGLTGQMTVIVNAATLTPGDYTGQIIISGQNPNASGNSQTIMVQLHVSSPCGLQAPSSAALAFTATQGGGNPSPQSVSFTALGSCSWPVNWQAGITSHARWLTLSPLSGTIAASGQAAMVSANVNVGNLAAGTYTTQVSIAASDSTPIQAQGSPEVFSVTLTVLQACQLQASTNSLNFSTPTGQVSSTQSVNIQETGNCARPVSWTASGDSGSSSWLIFSPPSGSDNGAGATVSVSINANSVAPGTYNGTINVTASGAGSSFVQGSPLQISVAVTVTGFGVNGTIYACATSGCAAPVPLPGATARLLSASGATMASAVTGANGTYSFSNMPLGTYTVSVAGTDASGVHYVGTAPVTVTGNMAGINLTVLPG